MSHLAHRRMGMRLATYVRTSHRHHHLRVWIQPKWRVHRVPTAFSRVRRRLWCPCSMHGSDAYERARHNNHNRNHKTATQEARTGGGKGVSSTHTGAAAAAALCHPPMAMRCAVGQRHGKHHGIHARREISGRLPRARLDWTPERQLMPSIQPSVICVARPSSEMRPLCMNSGCLCM